MTASTSRSGPWQSLPLPSWPSAFQFCMLQFRFLLWGRLANLNSRMLYRELKSSSRSYNRNRTNTTPHDVDTRNTAGASNARQSKRYNPNSRYGRNSVVIMSGWQESQEHLQDDSDGSQSQTKMSMSSGGVMKTEEVRVHHERLSTFSDENSIELRGLPAAQGKPGHQNAERAPSF